MKLAALLGLATLSAGALGLAVWQPFGGPGALVVDEPDRVVELTANRPADIVYRVRNTGRTPLRVIGMEGSCTRQLCFGPKDDELLTVPPGATVELVCEIKPRRPGPFSESRLLYLEDPTEGVRTITLVASGTIAPAEGRAN